MNYSTVHLFYTFITEAWRLLACWRRYSTVSVVLKIWDWFSTESLRHVAKRIVRPAAAVRACACPSWALIQSIRCSSWWHRLSYSPPILITRTALTLFFFPNIFFAQTNHAHLHLQHMPAEVCMLQASSLTLHFSLSFVRFILLPQK